MNTNSFKFRRPSSFLLTAGMAVCLASPTVGQAALLLGTLNFSSGSDNVTIATDMINFGTPSGTFTVTPSSGGFSALNGTTGLITNIDNPPYVVNVVTATPDFVTFDVAPNISITLLELFGGTNSSVQCGATPPAPGQSCTPPNSPYNLGNVQGGGSTASFVVLGNEVDSLTHTSVSIVGTFTAQFGIPFQTLLADVTAPNGSISTSYSATFTTQAPEPGTAATLALGAFGLAGLISFQRRRSEKQKASV